MKSYLAEPFLQAGIGVLEMFTGGAAMLGDPTERTVLFTTQDVSIILGISGVICGQVIYCMSEDTAIAIASAMMCSEETELNEMAISAISEMGNIISGNAMALLEQSGHQCSLSPPAIVRGIHVQMATQSRAVALSLQTPRGIVDVNIALKDNDSSFLLDKNKSNKYARDSVTTKVMV